MKKNYLNSLGLGAIIVATLFITSCQKSNFDNDAPGAAGLMAFNLAPEKSSVVFGVSGSLLTPTPLGYNSFTGGYLGIYPGTRNIEAYDNLSGDSIATTSFTFESGKYYSAFLVGSGSNYQNVVVRDNFDSLTSANGTAFIRYINAIPGSYNATVTIASGGNNVVNQTSAFANVSEFVSVPTGELTIAVNEGSTTSATRTITAEQSKIYTVLLAPGATTADPAQIKYITNGTADDEVSGQRISSAQSVNSK